MTLKRTIVAGLERLCTATHCVTMRRPFLWLPVRLCALSLLSCSLDERWNTDHWKGTDMQMR